MTYLDISWAEEDKHANLRVPLEFQRRNIILKTYFNNILF